MADVEADRSRYLMRFKDEETRAACEKRAKEKGISLNEWLNRAAIYAVTRSGPLKITKTETLEF